MAVAYVSKAQNQTSSTSTTVTLGSITDGYIVIAAVMTGGAGSAAITAPGGWSTISTGTFGGGDSARYAFFYIVASSLPTTAAFSSSDATFVNACCFWSSGGDSGTPIDTTSGIKTGTGNPVSWNGVTTATNNALVYAVSVGRNTYLDSANISAGYTNHANDTYATRITSKSIAVAGSETPGNGGQDIGNWVSAAIAIRESGAGGGGIVIPIRMAQTRMRTN